ncbi:hypothetical protein SH2C18_51010 [Clostridium sediminicola]|uniref:ABC transporter substrate-binding protein n=1 Tax=Clostridium sediminicola TaxID=3114879 RepID=UPI0031F204C9
MKNKIVSLIAISLVVVLALGGCGKSDSTSDSSTGSKESTSNKTGEPIKVATMPNHIGVPIQYAKDNGLYEEAGLNVEVILFPTGAPINEALSAEQVDIAGSGMASVFALASGDSYWLGDMVKTVDGLGIYVRPDSPILEDKGLIENLVNVYGSKETIKGLTILGALGTSDQFNAVSWVQQFGLTGNDYEMLNMDRGPAVQAFKTGEGDAIACGGPPYNYELEDAGYIEAADLTDVSGITISDGIVARKKFVDSRTEDVKKFLEVTYSVIDKFYKDDDMLADFAMGFYNDNGKDYSEEMMKGELKDKDYIGSVTISDPEYRFGSTMVGMGGFYVSDGKIEAELEENIYTSLYPELLEEVFGTDIEVFTKK